MAERQVAVFIDFENIARSTQAVYGRCDLDLVFGEAQRHGRCVIKRAYCDWTLFPDYRQQLIDHSVELIQMFAYGMRRTKNAADIQMVVDALETAFQHPDVETFVLVTGDSDYSAVARKLRGYGKAVVAIGQKDATSETLVKACDTFVLYDTLVEPNTRSATFALNNARRLLQHVMAELGSANAERMVYVSALKQSILDHDPTFSEVALGFDQFKSFLDAQPDLVVVKPAGPGATEVVAYALESAPSAEASHDARAYGQAFEAAGLRLIDPHTRTAILLDLYSLLRSEPRSYTLSAAAERLKEQYDTTNVLRTREEVVAAVRLLRFAHVVTPDPQSWEMDPLSLDDSISRDDFVDRCESSYLQVLLQNNLQVGAEQVALLVFGTADQRLRVESLLERAGQLAPRREPAGKAAKPSSGSFAGLDHPSLQVLVADLKTCNLVDEVSVERAIELARLGMETKPVDFQRASQYFLQAAKMTELLLWKDTSGVSQLDLYWDLGSYSSAMAGSRFMAGDYARASSYYLAFFALARDTEPVWERLRALVPPMLSYYFAIAGFEKRYYLSPGPGRTDPARMAITLCSATDPTVTARFDTLVFNLAKTNTALLRSVVQDLEMLARQGTDGAAVALGLLSKHLPKSTT